jgi:hypothetical protein
LSGPGALAVDDRGRRARLTPFALAGFEIECVMDALQCAVPIPQHEVGMRGASAANPSATPAPGSPSRAHRRSRSEPRGRSPRVDAHRVWPVVSPVRSAPTRGRSDRSGSASRGGLQHGDVQASHPAPLKAESGAREGITTDSTDYGSALRADPANAGAASSSPAPCSARPPASAPGRASRAVRGSPSTIGDTPVPPNAASRC